MRKKLIELLKSGGVRDFPFNAALADHLIANGATIPEWISVKDGLPEQFVDVLVFRNGNIEIDHHEGNGWFSYDFKGKRATHWMPMPQPPKGE